MAEDVNKSRQHQRQALQIDLTKILSTEDRTPIRCLGVDLSRNGLGIVGFLSLVTDTCVILQINEKGIKLKVVWSRADSVREGIFHVGLTTTDPQTNLMSEFKDAGLLSRVEQWSFPALNRKK